MRSAYTAALRQQTHKTLGEITDVPWKPSLTMRQAIVEVKHTTKSGRLRWGCGQLLTNVGGAVLNKPLTNLKSEDLSKLNETDRSTVNSLLRTLKGELPAVKEPKDGVVGFVSQPALIANLVKFLPIGGAFGRFPEVKMDVQRLISELPQDQWGTVRYQKSKVDAKDIKACSHAVKLWLKRNKIEWEFIWSPLGNFFILARTSQWKKIMEGGYLNGTSEIQQQQHSNGKERRG